MNKKTHLLFLGLLSLGAFAQEFYETQTEHFFIRSSQSSEESAEIGYAMEALYREYTQFLQLDQDLRNLRIQHFATEQEWLHHQEGQWTRPVSGNFYLLEKSELEDSTIYFYGEIALGENRKNLRHLLMIQMLQRINPRCPEWLKIGLAIYFEESLGEAPLQEGIYYRYIANLPLDYPWLSLEDILGLQQDSLEDDPRRKAELWLFFSYMLHQSQPDQARILWDSINSIKQGNAPVDLPFLEMQELEQGYILYRSEIQSVERILNLWKELYMENRFDELILGIQEHGHKFPGPAAYYKGLMAYQEGNWEQAIQWFETSIAEDTAVVECLEARIFCYWELGQRDRVYQLLDELPEEHREVLPESFRAMLDH